MGDKILVLNGMSYATAIEDLGEITYDAAEIVTHPERFKLVLFTGGADVSPEFYEDCSPKNICWTNPQRDRQELNIFKLALKHGILMAGICRGFQFLSVMAGGHLMHHLDGHGYGRHEMATNGNVIEVNTLHHQMVIPHRNAIIIGTSPKRLSNNYIGSFDSQIEYRGPEVEAAIFPKIRAFGVQYHPEMMTKDSNGYLFFYNMVTVALTDWTSFINSYERANVNYKIHDAHRSAS